MKLEPIDLEDLYRCQEGPSTPEASRGICPGLGEAQLGDEMKPRKIKPYGPTYKRERAQLAVQYVPEIRPCRDCGHPVVAGYCCTFCGSSTP